MAPDSPVVAQVEDFGLHADPVEVPNCQNADIILCLSPTDQVCTKRLRTTSMLSCKQSSSSSKYLVIFLLMYVFPLAGRPT